MERLASAYYGKEDDLHVRELRHELHKHAELELDLPETKAIVDAELDRLGIPHTGKYAPSGVVGYINYGKEDPEKAAAVGEPGHVTTIAFRADMDALRITEKTGLPFASIHPGIMHACGHDTHTAMLLGAACGLKRAELAGALNCRVKLIFQPNEEGEDTGSQIMIDNGVLSDVDFIFGQHIKMAEPTGAVLWNKGPCMGACRTYNVTFHGTSSHATTPQAGHDAIAMAVKAANDLYIMSAREFDPFKPFIVSIGSFHGGTAHNIIADKVELKISTRFFHEEVGDLISQRVRQICESAAAELSGTADVEDGASAFAVVNDAAVAERAIAAAKKITDEAHIIENDITMGSEDFSCFQRVRPGAFFHLGAKNPAKGCTGSLHNDKVVMDEDAFMTGSLLFIQMALDM